MVTAFVLCLVVFNVFRSRYVTAVWSDVIAMGAFFISAIACLGMGASYHALSNRSPQVNNLANKLDLLDFVLLIWGSMVSIIYYGRYCERTIKIPYCTMVSFSPYRLDSIFLTLATSRSQSLELPVPISP